MEETEEKSKNYYEWSNSIKEGFMALSLQDLSRAVNDSTFWRLRVQYTATWKQQQHVMVTTVNVGSVWNCGNKQ